MGCSGSKAEVTKTVETVPEDVTALLKKFNEGMNGNAEALKEACAEGCMFNPPGAPPMPMEAMAGMMTACKAVWPDWTSSLCFVEVGPDPDTFLVGTQQCMGVMKADFPAMGPFPAVAMADVPERCKTEPLTLPVEVGTYKIKDGKVASGFYAANGEFREDWQASGGVEPDAFTKEWWPKGFVGFGLVFKWFDKVDLLPPPPPAAPAPQPAPPAPAPSAAPAPAAVDSTPAPASDMDA